MYNCSTLTFCSPLCVNIRKKVPLLLCSVHQRRDVMCNCKSSGFYLFSRTKSYDEDGKGMIGRYDGNFTYWTTLVCGKTKGPLKTQSCRESSLFQTFLYSFSRSVVTLRVNKIFFCSNDEECRSFDVRLSRRKDVQKWPKGRKWLFDYWLIAENEQWICWF